MSVNSPKQVVEAAETVRPSFHRVDTTGRPSFQRADTFDSLEEKLKMQDPTCEGLYLRLGFLEMVFPVYLGVL